MATNFWELLQQHQGDLTKSGRAVADYLVQHGWVAEATAPRSCRALGFEG